MQTRQNFANTGGSVLTPLLAGHCYAAVAARDARFDGVFYTAVITTGIYCRPVCSARLPKQENCRFFHRREQAVQAGFRPCLRCRPEQAPLVSLDGQRLWSAQDASAILVLQAVQLLDAALVTPLAGEAAPSLGKVQPLSVHALALRLGIGERHLRRIFQLHMGLSPLHYLQNRRLAIARQLLSNTVLPITQVAQQSGFASVRRFHAAYTQVFGMGPRQHRAMQPAAKPTNNLLTPPVSMTPMQSDTALAGSLRVQLAYQLPYATEAMHYFQQTHNVPAMEIVAGGVNVCCVKRSFGLQKTLSQPPVAGWLEVTFEPLVAGAAAGAVSLTVSASLAPRLPEVIRRVRYWLDLDADPAAIDAVLQVDFLPGSAGIRIPGAMDGFELAVRAVLGQQVTVAAARTIAGRLVARFGAEIQTPWPEVNRLFPTPAVLAEASSDALGQLGIVRQRQAAIAALARCVASGELQLQPGAAGVVETVAKLQSLPGIGSWTAHYIALRALGWPDAVLAGDIALQKLLGVPPGNSPVRAAKAVEAAFERWRPWRGYAVLRVWAGQLKPASRVL